MPRCDTNTYEGCGCNKTERHPGPHRCEHGVQWAVRPDGRFFVIYEDHGPDVKGIMTTQAAPHLSADRRRPLCDDHVESSREGS